MVEGYEAAKIGVVSPILLPFFFSINTTLVAHLVQLAIKNALLACHNNDVWWCLLAGPPTITERPQEQKLTQGQAVFFSCLAEGNPTPTITWYRNGRTKLYIRSHLYWLLFC